MGNHTNWESYIKSPAWATKRQERLAIDDHRCVVCKGDGTDYRIEVHHLHYDSLGEEDALHDLVTVCARCHLVLQNIELLHRSKRVIAPSFVPDTIFARMEISYGMANASLQVEFLGPSDHAQRADSRPNESVVACDQEDFVQARQIGR